MLFAFAGTGRSGRGLKIDNKFKFLGATLRQNRLHALWTPELSGVSSDIVVYIGML